MDRLSNDEIYYVMNEMKHDDLIRFCQTNKQYYSFVGDQYWKDRVKAKYGKTELPWDLTWRRFDSLLEQEKIRFIPMVFVENFNSFEFSPEKNDATEKIDLALIKDDLNYIKESLFKHMKRFIQKYMCDQDSELLHYIYLETPKGGYEYEISVGKHNNVEIGMIIGMILKISPNPLSFSNNLSYIAMYSVELDESDD